MKNLLILSALFFCTSCHLSDKKNYQYVESKHITIPNSTINQTMKQEIYDKLYEIYQIKLGTINEYIRNSIFHICKNDVNEPLDSILEKYNIKINIKEPTAPSVFINNEFIHWEGNPSSTFSIIEIINPECDLCQITSQRIDHLHKGINSKVKIGYVIYSYESTFASQALLFASKQHKFKNLFDDLMLSSTPLDSATILNNMTKHNLDTLLFYNNLTSLKEECTNRNVHLRRLGISKTPTILVNNKFVYNPLDTNYIKKRLFSYKQE